MKIRYKIIAQMNFQWIGPYITKLSGFDKTKFSDFFG